MDIEKRQNAIFHILNKAIWEINNGREKEDKITILDAELGTALDTILAEDTEELEEAFKVVK